MVVIGIRAVVLSSVTMPGDVKRRQSTQNVEDLADDLGRWSQYIHDPLIRESDMRVICGRDRLAAALKMGFSTLPVKMIECTDLEAEMLELAENAHRRRDDESAKRARWQELLELQAAERLEDEKRRGTVDKRKTPKGQARKELAKKLGVTPGALKKQEARREEPAAASWGEDPPEAAPPPVALMGVAPSEEWLESVVEVQGLLDDGDRHLRALQAALTKLEKVALPLPQGRWQRLHKAAHALAGEVRAARPVSVCPWCKLVPRLRGVCTACATNAYIVEDQLQAVPPELQSEGMVAQNGRFVAIGEVRAELVVPPAAKATRKTMVIETPEGPVEVDRE